MSQQTQAKPWFPLMKITPTHTLEGKLATETIERLKQCIHCVKEVGVFLFLFFFSLQHFSAMMISTFETSKTFWWRLSSSLCHTSFSVIIVCVSSKFPEFTDGNNHQNTEIWPFKHFSNWYVYRKIKTSKIHSSVHNTKFLRSVFSTAGKTKEKGDNILHNINLKYWHCGKF